MHMCTCMHMYVCVYSARNNFRNSSRHISDQSNFCSDTHNIYSDFFLQYLSVRDEMPIDFYCGLSGRCFGFGFVFLTLTGRMSHTLRQ